MPMVIPAVVAFAAAGGTVAGVAAALTGAAGFATFATVAGGFLTSAGMITKNKTLTKIGSVLGIAGAVTSLASSLASGASSAAGSAAADGATEAVTEAAKESATEALKNEMASSAVGETIGQAGTEAASQAGQTLGTAAGNATNAAAGGAPLAIAEPGANLMDLARGTSDYGLVSRGLESASVITDTAQNQALGKLAEAGSQIQNKTALDSILEKVSGAGQWMKNNKELVQVGGQALAGGMQSYQQGQQFDEQMNLLEARRRRLNQPVVLGIQPIKIGG